MLREQVTAIRAGAAAIVAQADMILAALAPERLPLAATDGRCQHPLAQRRAAARMGQPNAWVCGWCGAEGGEEA